MSEIFRAETEAMEFENDWQGIFIRGDNALMFYLPAVEAAIRTLEKDPNFNVFELGVLRDLFNLLGRASSNPLTSSVQRLKPFVQCLRK